MELGDVWGIEDIGKMKWEMGRGPFNRGEGGYRKREERNKTKVI